MENQVVSPKPEKKRRTGLYVGLGLGCLFLICVAVTIIGAVIGTKFYSTIKEPIEVTAKYLDAVKNGNLEEAYDYIHPDTKEEMSFDDFKAVIERDKKYYENIKSYNWPSSNITNDIAQVKGTINYNDGRKKDVKATLKVANKIWKITEIHISK